MVATAVLVHGAWSSPADWRRVGDALKAEGVGFDAVDLPSHLRTDATRRDDVAAVEAAIRRVDGPVVAVGWSYGGAVIGDLDAASAPVEHLLYVASVPDVVDDTVTGERPQSQPNMDLLLFPTPETFVLDDDRWLTEGPGTEHFSDEVLDHLRTNRRRPMSLGAIGVPPEREAWRDVPTTAMIGSDDHLVPEAVRQWATQLPVSIRIIDGDHFLPLTRPDAVAEQICACFHRQ